MREPCHTDPTQQRAVSYIHSPPGKHYLDLADHINQGSVCPNRSISFNRDLICCMRGTMNIVWCAPGFSWWRSVSRSRYHLLLFRTTLMSASLQPCLVRSIQSSPAWFAQRLTGYFAALSHFPPLYLACARNKKRFLCTIQ